jgi:hypothetical protein
MAELLTTFTEPVHGIECRIWMVTPLELELSPFQRKESDNFVKKLAKSISIGFFAPPLVAVIDEKFVVIDGQHRLQAMIRAKGNFSIPAIELPKRYMYYALTYNVELADKIKDICTKGFYIYEHFTRETPEAKESSLSDYFLGIPYYITLSFAFMKHGLNSPSLVEVPTKKLDDWLDIPLHTSYEERQERGHAVQMLEETVNSAAKKAGFSEHILKQAIVSKTNMALWGRKRNVDEAFFEGINMMIEHIEKTDWGFLGK